MKKLVLITTAILAAFGWAQAQFTIENFDGTSYGYFSYKGGNAASFNQTATLAGMGGAYCGYTSRSGGDPYDNLVYTLTSSSMFTGTTVSALRAGTLKFKLKIATQANTGITVKLKLQNTSLSGAPNYAGNSEYDAVTTVGGSSNPYNWETLTFSMSTSSTAGTNITPVDQIVFLFVPNSNSSDAFFFDNLEVFDPAATTTGTSTGFNENYEAEKSTLVYPNPANGLTTIEYAQATSTDVKVSLNDVMGREVAQVETLSAGSAYRGQVDVSSLEPGIYYVNFQEAGVAKRMKKLVVTK